MAGLNPMYTALHESLSDPKAIDVVFWVYSRRKTSKWDKTIVHTPLPIYAMSSVLKKTEYFERRQCGYSVPIIIRAHSLPVYPSLDLRVRRVEFA